MLILHIQEIKVSFLCFSWDTIRT